MRKTLFLCLLALGGVTWGTAQTTETVSAGGSTVSKFVTGITVSGDNATLTYSDGTTQTADISTVNIDLGYKASLSGAAGATSANAATMANFGGKTIDVTVDRTINSGQWSAMTLPFDMSSSQIAAAFGEGTQVAVLDYADNGNINFVTQNSVVAGVPYIIQPANTVTSFSVENAGLKNLSKAATYAGTEWSFVGTVGAEQPSGNIRYIAQGNKIKTLSSGGTIYPLRAYLKGASAESKAVAFTVNGDVTGIMAIAGGEAAVVNTGVYNLQGQYLGTSAKGLPKGVYIINGKKQIIK